MISIRLGPGDLEAILAVAERGSFRGAAEALGLSQPAVSARIRHSETVLGVKLFHRTTRKVTITEAGERLRVRAEHTVAELRALVQEFNDESQLRRGRVVVGASPSVSGTVLPSIIKRFMQRWPGIQVVLQDDFFGRDLNRLATGEVDFAVLPFQPLDRQFDFERLFIEDFLVVVLRKHPLTQKAAATIGDIAAFPLLTMPPKSAIWGTLASAFAREELAFKPAFQALNMLSLLAMVHAGLGITLLPRIVMPLLNMEALQAVPVCNADLVRHVGIVTAHGRAVQPAAAALMRICRSALHK